jgi:hypothetical protein
MSKTNYGASTCPICGKHFAKTNNRQICCSTKCYNKGRLKVGRVTYSCADCGKLFDKKSNREKRCEECRLKISYYKNGNPIIKSSEVCLTCICCNKLFFGHNSRKVCSSCRLDRKNDVKKIYYNKDIFKHREYGKKHRARPDYKIAVKRRSELERVSGVAKMRQKKWLANNKIQAKQSSNLYTFYGKSNVTVKQKIDYALIHIGRRVIKNKIDKSTINEKIYRIQQGDTYAAYE